MLNAANRNTMNDGAKRRGQAMFLPCTAPDSPLERLPVAVVREPSVNLAPPSRAYSSFALSRNDPRPGEWLLTMTKSTRGGAPGGDPKGNDNLRPACVAEACSGRIFKPMNQRTILASSGFTSARRRPDSMPIGSQTQNLPRSFLRENSEAKTSNPTSMKGREPRQPHE